MWPKNFHHAQEIIDRLQNRTNPQVFTPKAVYDSKAILFAFRELCLSGGASGNVGVRFAVESNDVSVFAFQFNAMMSDRPPRPGAPVRGVYSVKLTRVAAQTVDFS
jgi:hypothetical protein